MRQQSGALRGQMACRPGRLLYQVWRQIRKAQCEGRLPVGCEGGHGNVSAPGRPDDATNDNGHSELSPYSLLCVSTRTLPEFSEFFQTVTALRQVFWVALLAIWAVLLLGGCGPGSSGSGESDLRRATQEIARTYLADGDLDKARTALDALEAANPRQWLVLVTEEAIGANDDPETTLALAKLATALKLQSGLINDLRRAMA